MANMSSRKLPEDGAPDQADHPHSIPLAQKDDAGEVEMVVLDAPFQDATRLRVGERITMPIYEHNVERGDPGTVESMKLDSKTGVLSILLRSIDSRFRGQTVTLYRMSGLTAVRVGKIPSKLPPDVTEDPNDQNNVKHVKFLVTVPEAPVESERTLKPVEA